MEKYGPKAMETRSGEVVGRETGGEVRVERAAEGAVNDARVASELALPMKPHNNGADKMSIAFITSAEGKDTNSQPTALNHEGSLDTPSVQMEEGVRLRNRKSRLEAAKLRFEKRLRQIEVEIRETVSEMALLGRAEKGGER